jgi:SPP1 gp7 family putative phage head morphogenesis protein
MLHVHVAHLVSPGAQPPGHRSERFRKRLRRLKPVRPSHKCELDYRGDLRVLTGALKIIATKHLLPELRRDFPGQLAHDAAVPPRLSQIVGDVARRFGGVQKQAEKIASLAAQRTLAATDERLARSIRDSMGVNIEPYLTGHGNIGKVLGEKVIANVDLIKTIPEEYFQGIADRVANNWRSGGRWENIVGDIDRMGEDTDARAEVIARDQTAKLNSAFNQVRQRDVGIEEYEWAAKDDERTRTDHWALNTTVHRWDEPGPLEGTIDGEPCHPGEDILCRCDALPYVDLDALEARLGLGPMDEEREAA